MRERVGERQGQNADADAESTPPYGDRLEAANCNQVANPQLSSKDKPPLRGQPGGGWRPPPGLAPLEPVPPATSNAAHAQQTGRAQDQPDQ